LGQVISVLDREAELLADVTRRLFADARPGPDWIQAQIATPEGADRLESFVGKFSRMQDNLVDKLIPLLLQAAGEQTGAAIDNLNRIERWGYLGDVPRWLGMRRLRNRLVHEYLENTADLAEALDEAQAFSQAMRETYGALRDFAVQRLALPPLATTNEADHV
jgi:uncharacterized protein with HEPN domain